MDQSEIRGTGNELEQRRQQVIRLRSQRFGLARIGQELNVSGSTVCRDLAWIRSHRDEAYGPISRIDSAEYIGEAVRFYGRHRTHRADRGRVTGYFHARPTALPCDCHDGARTKNGAPAGPGLLAPVRANGSDLPTGDMIRAAFEVVKKFDPNDPEQQAVLPQPDE
jgi:hypothetical protein